MRSFHLTKWYLDCVSEEGDLFIGYAARIRLGLVTLPLTGKLRRFKKEVSSDSSVDWLLQMPARKGESLEWRNRAIGISGTWSPMADAIDLKLVKSMDGNVRWSGVQPMSRVSLDFGDGNRMNGIGYVELVDMSLPPWKLGLTNLRWGRFLSPSDQVVWIIWDGKFACSRILHNGSVLDGADCTDNQIRLGKHGVLSLEQGEPLRSGVIDDTVLAKIPFARKLLPSFIRTIEETKWICRGRLICADGAESTGWIIHERVSFES
jgi:hypothetical protein